MILAEVEGEWSAAAGHHLRTLVPLTSPAIPGAAIEWSDVSVDPLMIRAADVALTDALLLHGITCPLEVVFVSPDDPAAVAAYVTQWGCRDWRSWTTPDRWLVFTDGNTILIDSTIDPDLIGPVIIAVVSDLTTPATCQIERNPQCP